MHEKNVRILVPIAADDDDDGKRLMAGNVSFDNELYRKRGEEKLSFPENSTEHLGHSSVKKM